MNNDEFYIRDRDHYLNKILNSDTPRKLIIAGPGTGKTHTFKKLLEKSSKSSEKRPWAMSSFIFFQVKKWYPD